MEEEDGDGGAVADRSDDEDDAERLGDGADDEDAGASGKGRLPNSREAGWDNDFFAGLAVNDRCYRTQVDLVTRALTWHGSTALSLSF